MTPNSSVLKWATQDSIAAPKKDADEAKMKSYSIIVVIRNGKHGKELGQKVKQAELIMSCQCAQHHCSVGTFGTALSRSELFASEQMNCPEAKHDAVS